MQIALSLTCPKNPIGEQRPSAFADDPVEEKSEVEITQKERDNIAELMSRLGL